MLNVLNKLDNDIIFLSFLLATSQNDQLLCFIPHSFELEN